MRTKAVTKAQLRSFGLTLGVAFGIIALWPVIRGGPPRTTPLIVAAILFGSALIVPQVLRGFHRVWMGIGEALGWVNSRIILGVIYYLVIVPIGMLRRMFGSDPMARQFERDAVSYRIPRAKRATSHMRHQY